MPTSTRTLNSFTVHRVSSPHPRRDCWEKQRNPYEETGNLRLFDLLTDLLTEKTDMKSRTDQDCSRRTKERSIVLAFVNSVYAFIAKALIDTSLFSHSLNSFECPETLIKFQFSHRSFVSCFLGSIMHTSYELGFQSVFRVLRQWRRVSSRTGS